MNDFIEGFNLIVNWKTMGFVIGILCVMVGGVVISGVTVLVFDKVNKWVILSKGRQK